MLGSTAAKVLGVDRADGTVSVYIDGRWFTVIGILESVELVPSMDRAALIGFDIAQKEFGIDGSASTVYVRTHPDAVDAVGAVLPRTANPEAPNEVTVTRPSDALEARAQELERSAAPDERGVARLVAVQRAQIGRTGFLPTQEPTMAAEAAAT